MCIKFVSTEMTVNRKEWKWNTYCIDPTQVGYIQDEDILAFTINNFEMTKLFIAYI